jgi:hypothetical protein
MLCNDEMFVYRIAHGFSKLNKSEDFVNKIRNYLQVEWFTNQTATWNDNFAPVFTATPTKVGFGFTFNMESNQELFTDE